MKPIRSSITAALAALMVALPLATSAAQAQEDPDPQELMKEIQERMREIEQRLARASLEPEDLATIIHQLRDAVENQNFDELPESLSEFLESNPDLLARLQNPNASEEELREAEDDVRRLLELDPEGLENLLSDNPEILERLLDSQEEVEEALRQHQQAQNDLERLFRDTEDRMRMTEDEIERLIELAHEMQEQMCCSGSQSSREQLEQEREEQELGEEPEHADGDEQEYDPQGDRPEDETADSDSPDPDAWDIPGLPQRDVENYRDAQSGQNPRGYEAESNAYMRELARAAARQQQQEQQEEGEQNESDNEAGDE